MAIKLIYPDTNNINEIKYTDKDNNTYDVKCLRYNTQNSWAKPFRLYMNCTNGAVANVTALNYAKEPNASATNFGTRKNIEGWQSTGNGRAYWGDGVSSHFSIPNYQSAQKVFESTKIYYGSSTPVTDTGGVELGEEIYNVDLDYMRLQLSNSGYWNNWPDFSSGFSQGSSKTINIDTTGDYNTVAIYGNALRWDSRSYPDLHIYDIVTTSTNYLLMYRSDYYDFDYFQLKIYVNMYDDHISSDRIDTYLYTKAIKLSEISTNSSIPTMLAFTGRGRYSDSTWVDTRASDSVYLRAYLYRDTSRSYDHVMVAVEYTQGQGMTFDIESYYYQQAVFFHEPGR